MSEPAKARLFLNPNVCSLDLVADSKMRAPLEFHQRLPGYRPTPLLDVPELARMLGIGQVLVKDESNRLGLPAFKILGASWAVYRALEKRAAESTEGRASERPGFAATNPSKILEPWQTIEELAKRLAPLRPLTLATATDGNHGRAVAHMAALLGLQAQIYVPAGTAQARIDGIASEGARVEMVDGTYDDAVARAAQDASARCLVISDTSWPGYEEVPHWVMEGYSTIMTEIDDDLAGRGETRSGSDRGPVRRRRARRRGRQALSTAWAERASKNP